MQSGSQIPPDVSIGYGTDPEERGNSLVVGLVFLALVVAVVVYGIRAARSGKRGRPQGPL